eukprot:3968457-Heterocapsa_arctica.AAC.1
MFLKLKLGFSSSAFVQNDQRSARNIMAIARMPANLQKHVKTFKNLQTPSQPYAPVRVHL